MRTMVRRMRDEREREAASDGLLGAEDLTTRFPPGAVAL